MSYADTQMIEDVVYSDVHENEGYRSLVRCPSERLLLLLPPATLLVAILVAGLRGLSVESVARPLAVWGILVLVGFKWQTFQAGIHALSAMLLFSVAWPLLIDGVATIGQPLSDDRLLDLDHRLGLSELGYTVPTAWQPLLAFAYESAVVQTWIVVLYLGVIRGDRLGRFVTAFMVCALLTTVGFALWPAEGTFHGEATYLERIRSLRDGTLQRLSWQQIEGIVTYPSFHAAWAVLLTAAAWRTWLFGPLLVLNILMVASAVPAGQHYYIDILAGLLLAACTLILVEITYAKHGLKRTAGNCSGDNRLP